MNLKNLSLATALVLAIPSLGLVACKKKSKAVKVVITTTQAGKVWNGELLKKTDDQYKKDASKDATDNSSATADKAAALIAAAKDKLAADDKNSPVAILEYLSAIKALKDETAKAVLELLYSSDLAADAKNVHLTGTVEYKDTKGKDQKKTIDAKNGYSLDISDLGVGQEIKVRVDAKSDIATKVLDKTDAMNASINAKMDAMNTDAMTAEYSSSLTGAEGAKLQEAGGKFIAAPQVGVKVEITGVDGAAGDNGKEKTAETQVSAEATGKGSKQ